MAKTVKGNPNAGFLVQFIRVGARKVSWEERIERPVTDEKLIAAIRRRRVLMSRGIDVSESGDYGGGIYVGLVRKVGTYFIVPGSEGVEVAAHQKVPVGA